MVWECWCVEFVVREERALTGPCTKICFGHMSVNRDGNSKDQQVVNRISRRRHDARKRITKWSLTGVWKSSSRDMEPLWIGPTRTRKCVQRFTCLCRLSSSMTNAREFFCTSFDAECYLPEIPSSPSTNELTTLRSH